MPTYLFTYHAYRSWNADRPRGFVQRGRGIQPPNSGLAHYYDTQSTQPPVSFELRHQATMTWIAWDACRRRGWRLHDITTDASHVHILVSWTTDETWELVRAKLKNLLSWALTREFDLPGRKWLVAEASRKQVTNQRHFDYLVGTYLPSHRGLHWQEGDRPPDAPAWALNCHRGAENRRRGD